MNQRLGRWFDPALPRGTPPRGIGPTGAAPSSLLLGAPLSQIGLEIEATAPCSVALPVPSAVMALLPRVGEQIRVTQLFSQIAAARRSMRSHSFASTL